MCPCPDLHAGPGNYDSVMGLTPEERTEYFRILRREQVCGRLGGCAGGGGGECVGVGGWMR